jgi:hypothetical protein
LRVLPAGNFELPAFPALLLKDNDWRWPERNLAGNAIDFFSRSLGCPLTTPRAGSLQTEFGQSLR